MVKRMPISQSGFQRLRDELRNLEKYERMAVIQAIETARGHGDLKENAEYHAAKERQGHIEGRIMDLKDKLGRAEIIDCRTVKCNKAIFGTIVALMDLDNDEEMSYQLLGPDETDVKNGRISILSPLGRALIGKSVGEEIEFKSPGGLRRMEIMDITPGLEA